MKPIVAAQSPGLGRRVANCTNKIGLLIRKTSHLLWETSLQFWETSGIPSKRGTGVKSEGVAKTPEDSIDGDETQVVDPIAPRKIMGPRSSLQVVPNRGN